MYAEGLRTDSDLFMRGATITSTNEDGAIQLLDAHVGVQLDLDDITVINTAGPALNADGLRTDSDLFMREATITGTGENSARSGCTVPESAA